jgi:hypothetical protein
MLRECPFCHKKIKGDYPYLTYLDNKKIWCLAHYCAHPPSCFAATIDVYGLTPQECYDKWNGVWHEDEESESL